MILITCTTPLPYRTFKIHLRWLTCVNKNTRHGEQILDAIGRSDRGNTCIHYQIINWLFWAFSHTYLNVNKRSYLRVHKLPLLLLIYFNIFWRMLHRIFLLIFASFFTFLTNRKVHLSSLLNALADFFKHIHTAKHKKQDLHTVLQTFRSPFFYHSQFRPNCFPIHMLTTFFLVPSFIRTEKNCCMLLETYKAQFFPLSLFLQIMNVLFIQQHQDVYAEHKSDLFFIPLASLLHLGLVFLVYTRTV